MTNGRQIVPAGPATVPDVELAVVIAAAPDPEPEDGNGAGDGDEEAAGVLNPDEEDERARAFLLRGAYATVAVERYDDLAAIFGKIDAASSPRVALVAPRGNYELQRRLSMRRLQRHLDLHGQDLILVSRSRMLRLRAREEGLPAVGSLRRVNFRRIGRDGLNLGWLTLRMPTLGALLALALLALALAGGAAMLFWYLPKADVIVLLPTTPVDSTFNLTLDTQRLDVAADSLAVPATRRKVTVERSFFRPATGSTAVPVDHAAVALRFTNRTTAAVRVPKGTVVIAQNNVRFTTGNDVDLPRLNTTGDAVALAQVPGTVGNVPLNSIRTIEGPLNAQVAVTNTAAGEKGRDLAVQSISEADVEAVRAYANAVLIDAARDELARLTPKDTFVPQSAVVQGLELIATPAAGAAASYTEVRVRADVSMLAAAYDDLREVYVSQFQPFVPADQMLLDNEFTTAVEGAGQPEQAFDRMPITVRVQGLAAPLLNRDALRELFAGQTRKDVAGVVREYAPGSPPPIVSVSPGWAPRIPRKADRIAVSFAPAPPEP